MGATTEVVYLQEANPGDIAANINLCITAEADIGSFLARSVPVSFHLSADSEAGMQSNAMCGILAMSLCLEF